MNGGPIRLGLIGAGRWGRNYIKTISRLAGFALVRLASSNPDSRTLVNDACTISEDWRVVAWADDLDGVIIATPPAVHFEMAHAAIDAGNPVLIEKPLTLDRDEARVLQDFAEKRNAIVHVDHIHLYHPAYRMMKNVGLGMGPVHAMRSGAGDWGPFREDTPMLWDRGSHEAALCLDLLGEKPETVSVRLKEKRVTNEGPGEAIAIQLVFAGGVKADIELSNLLDEKKRFFAVHHDRETLIYDDVGADVLVREPRVDDANCSPEKTEVINVPDTLPLDQVLFDFAAAITKGDMDISGLRLGVDVVDVLYNCQQSLNESSGH
ncbi:MAG: Gfo/Idh/MocA family oxidoreductase [Rhodospirillales bacterium]|nr:Gfo/Idh/MocA family oxidoreductase [Rhodospirillales bacterium]